MNGQFPNMLYHVTYRFCKPKNAGRHFVKHIILHSRWRISSNSSATKTRNTYITILHPFFQQRETRWALTSTKRSRRTSLSTVPNISLQHIETFTSRSRPTQWKYHRWMLLLSWASDRPNSCRPACVLWTTRTCRLLDTMNTWQRALHHPLLEMWRQSQQESSSANCWSCSRVQLAEQHRYYTVVRSRQNFDDRDCLSLGASLQWTSAWFHCKTRISSPASSNLLLLRDRSTSLVRSFKRWS